VFQRQEHHHKLHAVYVPGEIMTSPQTQPMKGNGEIHFPQTRAGSVLLASFSNKLPASRPARRFKMLSFYHFTIIQRIVCDRQTPNRWFHREHLLKTQKIPTYGVHMTDVHTCSQAAVTQRHFHSIEFSDTAQVLLKGNYRIACCWSIIGTKLCRAVAFQEFSFECSLSSRAICSAE